MLLTHHALCILPSRATAFPHFESRPCISRALCNEQCIQLILSCTSLKQHQSGQGHLARSWWSWGSHLATKPILLWLSPDPETSRPPGGMQPSAFPSALVEPQMLATGHSHSLPAPRSQGSNPGSRMWPQTASPPMNREVKQTALSCALWKQGSFPAPPFLPTTGG